MGRDDGKENAMGVTVEKLTGLIAADDRFAIPHTDLRAAQVAAMNERFQERRGRIKLPGHRAVEANCTEIRVTEDAVPLLFPHTAYKSYPEAWLIGEKWDRMSKWLGKIFSYAIGPLDGGGS